MLISFSLLDLFIRNIIKLAGGTTLAQLMPFVVLPFLTLAMGAESFGVFSIFLTTSLILGALTSLRYEYSINAAKNKYDVKLLCYVASYINLFSSIIILIVTAFFYIFSLVELEWMLLPVSVYLFGKNQILYMKSNYDGQFNLMANSKVVNAFCCSIFQFLVVFVFGLKFGAYLGIVVGLFLSNVYLISKSEKYSILISKLRVAYVLKKYKKYPIFVLPGTFLNYLSANLPIYALGYFFGSSEAGYYSLATRLAGVPTTMIGRSIGEVFRNKALIDFNFSGRFQSILGRVSGFSMVISVVGFSVLYFIIDYLIVIFFGSEWIKVSYYIKLLLPFFMLQFVSSTISYSLMIVGWQVSELYWQAFRMVLVFMAVLVAVGYESEIGLVVLSMAALTFSYLIHIVMCFLASSGIRK